MFSRRVKVKVAGETLIVHKTNNIKLHVGFALIIKRVTTGHKLTASLSLGISKEHRSVPRLPRESALGGGTGYTIEWLPTHTKKGN